MSDSVKHRAVKGVMWSAVERFSVQGIQFVLSIVIARLVLPSEYGLIAMLGIFLAIAQTFVDSGFSNALIQKKDRTEVDYSTVFYFNILIALVVYGVLFISAPYIASFYREPELTVVTRWVGLNLLLNGLSIVQRAKLTVCVGFKTQAKASLIAVLMSGLVAVCLAYRDYGVWALVLQSLLSSFLNTLLLWIFSRWLPLWCFSWKSFRSLFSFGSKLLLSGLLHTIYINLYSLVIGRRYSAMDVGFYNRANQFSGFPSTNLVGIITRVIYSVQCELQDDTERLNRSFMCYLRVSCYIIFPLMTLLAVLSDPLIRFLLTDKWLPSAELLSILCIAYMWYPVMVINNQILNVKGRSDYFLRAEILKKVVAIAILCATLPFGVRWLCWGIVLYNFSDIGIIIYYSKKVISTGYMEQIKNIFPLFLLSLGMGMSAYIAQSMIKGSLPQLIIGGLVALFSYLLLGFLFKVRESRLLFSLIKKYI